MSNYYLIGFMGAGKTTIGRKLASKINYQFIDLDDYIERRYKHTITSIFNLVGEEGFRKIENQALQEVALLKNVIVSTGGGTPCFFDNMDIIKKNGVSIYLKYTPKFLYKRLVNARKERPLIKKNKENLLEYITDTLLLREEYYMKADYKIEKINISTKDILEFITKP